jgi:AraC-like DNA-binding protein
MATTLTSWAQAVRRALLAVPVDADALLRRAGIDPGSLDDAQARCPVTATARLWALSVEASGDPAFGITVARHTTPGTFHALGGSLLASATLWDALSRLVRYFRVVTEAAELVLSRDGGAVRLAVRPPTGGPAPAPEAIDAVTYLVVRLCRALLSPDFAPRSVRLRRARPRDVHPYERAFRAPLTFGAPVDELLFDAAAFDQPLQGANARTAHEYDEVATLYLARLARTEVGARVRGLLCQQLSLGEPTPESIAERLFMSVRTLQRRLASEGTTFKALLDDTRRELALAYLAEGRYGIGEIAYLLGFSHAASFTHACTRWTGKPPRELRKATRRLHAVE